MDLARAPRRARLTARKKGSGYENEGKVEKSEPKILFCVAHASSVPGPHG